MQFQGVDGRARAVIEAVSPEVDAGRFPIKRTVGEAVEVEADIYTDGHDQLTAVLRYRPAESDEWQESPMAPLVNDRWRGSFTVGRTGRYCYALEAWVDHFLSWHHDLARRREAEDIRAALLVGADLAEAAAGRTAGDDAGRLQALATALRADTPLEERRDLALGEELQRLMGRHPDRSLATAYGRELEVVVERERAGHGAWYEFFPRSCRGDGEHADFADCEARLAYVAAMGFDIVYLPPVHPIGRTKRKGRNNSLTPTNDDPGSPWAIGAGNGGHAALHPQLGDEGQFRRFIGTAAEHGLEVALDIAFQCSPDHPYVREHPEWFRHRPDGTVQYAENPPKRYEDIYPFDFETEAWQPLWEELRAVVRHWVELGVRIFRVDNPHTKPFAFWEWLITTLRAEHPDLIFLSEAFARPKIMRRLAKAGFSQSYTYFTWRNTKWELTEYLHELTRGESRDYLRPNFWPNTPDILPEYLQFGGRAGFMARLVLAATLGANYGIYGPAFELLEARPREPGSEEYLDSEKYEIRRWPLDRPESLADFIARVNRIRRDNRALRQDRELEFHAVDNEELIAYSKRTEGAEDIVLVVVNLDVHHAQGGYVELPLERFGVEADRPYQVHDLLSGARFLWHGARNYVQLDPQQVPAHIFRLRRRVRSERDFEYFM